MENSQSIKSHFKKLEISLKNGKSIEMKAWSMWPLMLNEAEVNDYLLKSNHSLFVNKTKYNFFKGTRTIEKQYVIPKNEISNINLIY